MFLNPWYLQQQAAKAEQADQHNQNTINLNLQQEEMESSPSPQSSQDSGLVKESEEVHCPSPAPSVLSAGSCGSGRNQNLHQVNVIQSSLKPGWTVHITPEGRLYYCK